MKKNNTIIITDSAINYLENLINIEQENDLIIYLSVLYPHTEYAHVNVAYCKTGDLNILDFKLEINKIDIYIEHGSIDLLENSIIDFKDTQLLINAPNIYKKNHANIKEQIKNLFENEINVMLSQHGGFVELITLENNDTVKIKFHGGCQGCGMVGYTLSNYIEKIIKKHFPNIKKIVDITSHNIKDNSYY